MTTEERESKSADWRRENLGKNVDLADVSKSFSCANEKMMEKQCDKQCMACAVEDIRKIAQ